MGFAQECRRSELPLKPPLAWRCKAQRSPNRPLSAAHHPLRLAKPSADRTSLLSDELLLRVLSNLSGSQTEINRYALVCKRWLSLLRQIPRSLKVLDLDFILSGRLVSKFPNLTHLDIVHACFIPPARREIMWNRGAVSVYLDASSDSGTLELGLEGYLIKKETIDGCLIRVARGFHDLRSLTAIGASETGLLILGEECPALQILELHCCSDAALRGIAACRNLQVLKLIGNAAGRGRSGLSDLGLTIMANGCGRLVKLELSGCGGSYDGMRAIGQCCQMLEELSVCDHGMEGGWTAALPCFENLKTLRFRSCKAIDSAAASSMGNVGSCPALEQLHFVRCRIARELFAICENVREIVIEDCPGLRNDTFRFAATCRRVQLLSLRGCSLLTAGGLEPVILSWHELRRLRVVSCNNIDIGEVAPSISILFSSLQELTWKPDSKSAISSGLLAFGMGRRGRQLFSKF